MWGIDDDPFYDIAARNDARREAYGAPCPKHGTLTWGGDCGDCLAEWELDDEQRAAGETGDGDAYDESLRRGDAGEHVQPAIKDWDDDDIPF